MKSEKIVWYLDFLSLVVTRDDLVFSVGQDESVRVGRLMCHPESHDSTISVQMLQSKGIHLIKLAAYISPHIGAAVFDPGSGLTPH